MRAPAPALQACRTLSARCAAGRRSARQRPAREQALPAITVPVPPALLACRAPGWRRPDKGLRPAAGTPARHRAAVAPVSSRCWAPGACLSPMLGLLSSRAARKGLRGPHMEHHVAHADARHGAQRGRGLRRLRIRQACRAGRLCRRLPQAPGRPCARWPERRASHCGPTGGGPEAAQKGGEPRRAPPIYAPRETTVRPRAVRRACGRTARAPRGAHPRP